MDLKIFVGLQPIFSWLSQGLHRIIGTMNAPAQGKRIYLINRDFQLKYVRWAVLVGVGSTLLTVVVILYPLFQFRILHSIAFLPTPFFWAMAIAGAMNFAAVATLALLITHRIAGPMFSLVRQFRQIQTGKYGTGLRVREDDELKFVVRNFNDLVDYLINTARGDHACIVKVVEKMRSGDGAGALKDAEDLADALQARVAVPAPPVAKEAAS